MDNSDESDETTLKIKTRSGNGGKLWVTDLGMFAAKYLYDNFDNLFNFGFTSEVEN